MRWEIIERYRLDIVVPIALIIFSEILIFRGNMREAMLIDALNLAMLVLSAIYTVNRLYVALMLLPLFRLLNVAMPIFFHLTLNCLSAMILKLSRAEYQQGQAF